LSGPPMISGARKRPQRRRLVSNLIAEIMGHPDEPGDDEQKRQRNAR
jgi:hypothetical protein